MKKGSLHIGTSGWYYDHWVGTFYPNDTKKNERLAYYLRFFKTVELNSPFYRLPSPATFTKWAETVPKDFIFSVKGNRHITHMKKLKVGKEDLAGFFAAVESLEKKLGPILFQLPPNWKANIERLSHFLGLLPDRHRYTLEFRDSSWYAPAVYDLLRKHNIAFCQYELAGHRSPQEITASFVYIRLHGPGGKYQGNYPKETLRNWMEKCREWQNMGKDVYLYFDNDEAGYAAFNARQLLALAEPANVEKKRTKTS